MLEGTQFGRFHLFRSVEQHPFGYSIVGQKMSVYSLKLLHTFTRCVPGTKQKQKTDNKHPNKSSEKLIEINALQDGQSMSV